MNKYPPKHMIDLEGTESEKELDNMAIYDLAEENQELTRRLHVAEKVIDRVIEIDTIAMCETVMAEAQAYRDKYPPEEEV